VERFPDIHSGCGTQAKPESTELALFATRILGLVASRIALVRRPGARLADGLVTHQERVAVDVGLAVQQWESYVAALLDNGWQIVEVDPIDECPDAVFIEDAVVVFGDLAVITRPGAESRRAETAGAERAARAIGLQIHRITEPATLDGGDVLKVGRTVYVGVSGRTNIAGVGQLGDLLEPLGWTVQPVPLTRVLHLKSAVTALPDGMVIGFPQVVDNTAVFERFLAVPEPAGAHVLLLGDDRLLMSSDARRAAEMFRSLGYDPIEVNISEFEKLEGCVTCLSVRIRR
jgi:dimethylargininase